MENGHGTHKCYYILIGEKDEESGKHNVRLYNRAIDITVFFIRTQDITQAFHTQLTVKYSKCDTVGLEPGKKSNKG